MTVYFLQRRCRECKIKFATPESFRTHKRAQGDCRSVEALKAVGFVLSNRGWLYVANKTPEAIPPAVDQSPVAREIAAIATQQTPISQTQNLPSITTNGAKIKKIRANRIIRFE